MSTSERIQALNWALRFVVWTAKAYRRGDVRLGDVNDSVRMAIDCGATDVMINAELVDFQLSWKPGTRTVVEAP